MKFNTIQFLMFSLITTLVASCGSGGEGSEIAAKPNPFTATEQSGTTTKLDEKISAGKLVYEKNCQTCHQADAKGLPAAFPPLANSDYLNADINRAISGVVNGLSGEITVNGEKYNQNMPASTLSDDEVAAAFTYVLNNYGNTGGEVMPEDVKSQRKN